MELLDDSYVVFMKGRKPNHLSDQIDENETFKTNMGEDTGCIVLLRSDAIEGRLNAIEQMVADVSSDIKGISIERQDRQFITRKEVAKLFSVSEVTVDSWRKEGIIVAYAIGNTVRYVKQEVLSAPIPKVIDNRR